MDKHEQYFKIRDLTHEDRSKVPLYRILIIDAYDVDTHHETWSFFSRATLGAYALVEGALIN